MWALEYDPELFTLYEGDETHNKSNVDKTTKKSRRQYGKYERANRRSRAQARGGPQSATPVSIFVFLVASVLKDRNDKLLKEARGLDDVVKVNFLTSFRKHTLMFILLDDADFLNFLVFVSADIK